MARQKSQAGPSELSRYLSKSGRVLDALGYSNIPTDHNPVWCALQGLSPIPESEVWEMVDAEEMTESEASAYLVGAEENIGLAEMLRPIVWRGKSHCKGDILKCYVVCQTAALNDQGGSIGTGDLGTIRQRWYTSKNPRAMGFKMAAMSLERHLVQSADVVLVPSERARSKATELGAQRIEFKVNWSKADEKLLENELSRLPRIHIWPAAGWGRAYAQKQSQILADLVRDGLTYEQLWVHDVSRKFYCNDPLVPGFHAVLMLEKEGLLEHFEGFCRAAGIPILVAAKGNNSFATVEALINDNFRDWDGKLKPSPENPLHLFTITDHDYAGHVPVQDGAFRQFARYLSNGAVQLCRIGVTREQLKSLGLGLIGHAYLFDHDHNKAYREWADEHGIWIGDKCYGIEVEALVPGDYIPYIIDAIVEALGGDEALRDKLAQMAEPDWWKVQETITDQLRKLSELWRRLTALCDWSEETRESDAGGPSENWVVDRIGSEDDDDAWRNQEEIEQAISEKVTEQRDTVDFDAFTKHVKEQSWGTWRPVGSEAASRAVVEIFTDGHNEAMKEFTEGLDWQHEDLLAALRDVFDVLDYHGLEFES